MSNLSLELPINGLSFGNCAVGLLSALKQKNIDPVLFSIGERADLSSFDKLNLEFYDWLKKISNKSEARHSRDNPIFKLWHIGGSLSSLSKEQTLFTFYELDSPTETELNILRNQKNVIVSSSYTKAVFESFGLENVHFTPLGFDNLHFTRKEKVSDDKITFSLFGKLEKRKQHHKVLQSWAKKYGNNSKYQLNCAIQNPFLDQNQQNQAISNILEGKSYFNINFLAFMPTNSLYNDFLNYSDIAIAMSAGEGWGLPEFQSVCLGKHAVVLNAHAYKDWANNENSTLVQPSGKIEAYDGVFFKKGLDFNQGNYFDWNPDDFISACEEAEKKFLSNPVNENGLKLAEKFTWTNSLDRILSVIAS